jgi:hypothetical protein
MIDICMLNVDTRGFFASTFFKYNFERSDENQVFRLACIEHYQVSFCKTSTSFFVLRSDIRTPRECIIRLYISFQPYSI